MGGDHKITEICSKVSKWNDCGKEDKLVHRPNLKQVKLILLDFGLY